MDPVPGCVAGGDSTTLPADPAEYMRVEPDLAVRSDRFSLCSNPSCFGRLKAVTAESWFNPMMILEVENKEVVKNEA